MSRSRRVLLWHVHGSYTTALVQGRHEYLLPVLPDRGPDGRGRARTWDWPTRAHERRPAELHDEEFDVVIVQRPNELDLVARWTGRCPGRDVPVVYLEHNTPPRPYGSRHPVADRPDIPLVHVTHANRLAWDTGAAPVRVVEHGVVDPGHRYTGELPRAAIVANDPVRRGAAVGADLFDAVRRAAPVDLFGMGTAPLGGSEGLTQAELHTELARRRVYVHPVRWTSLGLSLIEAMHLGLPVVALACTEVPRAVPAGCGITTTAVDELCDAVRDLVADPARARALGAAGRAHAVVHYGLDRFLADWDTVLEEVTA